MASDESLADPSADASSGTQVAGNEPSPGGQLPADGQVEPAGAPPPAAGVPTGAPSAPEGAPPAEDMEHLLREAPGSGGTRASALQQAKVGDRVSGVLVRIGEESSFVDFGGRSEGVIRTSELRGDDGELAFSPGEPLEAFVVADGDGIALSRFVSGEARRADLLYKAFKSGIPVEGKVMAVNKWGLGVDLEGMRAFCPVSQIDTQFTQDPEQFRDRTMTFKIIRFRDRGRSIVLSRRALVEASQQLQADTVRQRIAVGAELDGTVIRLESYGAFVDVGAGVEGLVHVSELRHERVGHPQEVVQPGQPVKVKVIAVKSLGNRRKERISLSLKALEKDPWEQVRRRFRPGSVATGRVEAIEDYGAFVELAPNVRGLVHVSEMADRRINHPRDVVAVGDEVKVAVLEVDDRRKRLRLSLRRAEQAEGETNLREFAERQRREQEDVPANTAMLEALKRAQLID